MNPHTFNRASPARHPLASVAHQNVLEDRLDFLALGKTVKQVQLLAN